MKYFLHDANAFSDEKITLLYLEFGFEAIGLFFTILEKLALQEQPINETVLKSQLNIKKRLEKQLNFMYEISILSLRNGDVFSENILKFSEKYQIKKEKTRKRVSQWRENQTDEKSVTRYERVRNTPKDTISKDTISKVKESNKEKDIQILKEIIFKAYNFNEMNYNRQNIEITKFCQVVNIQHAKTQIENYLKHSEIENNKYRVTYQKLIGSEDVNYNDGIWNQENWQDKLKFKISEKSNNNGRTPIEERKREYDEYIKQKEAKKNENNKN